MLVKMVSKKTARNKLKTIFIIVLVGLGAVSAVHFLGSNWFHEREINELIISEMRRREIPGLAGCIVMEGEVTWIQGYGYANITEKKPVMKETLFLLASISKTVTAMALLQLYEVGDFNLDDDVNDYMPFNVTNPHFPDAPLTFRMLLAHTSSLQDNWENFIYCWGTDCPITLREWLESYLTPDGEYYDPNLNFLQEKPGTSEEYSNVGYTLIGYLVESISGISFDQYCKVKIFQPLGMNNTAWFLKDLNLDEVAIPYDGYRRAYAHYTYPDYPDGQLRSSVEDLSRILITIIQNGTYNDVQILNSTTVEEMRTPQFPQISPEPFGLGGYYFEFQGRTLFGHHGVDLGVSTLMFYNPTTNVGAIVLSNMEGADLSNILNKLLEVGERTLNRA